MSAMEGQIIVNQTRGSVKSAEIIRPVPGVISVLPDSLGILWQEFPAHHVNAPAVAGTLLKLATKQKVVLLSANVVTDTQDQDVRDVLTDIMEIHHLKMESVSHVTVILLEVKLTSARPPLASATVCLASLGELVTSASHDTSSHMRELARIVMTAVWDLSWIM